MKLFTRVDCEKGVHDFQPRYDESMPNIDGVSYTGFGDLNAHLDSLKSRYYVADVCRRCGKKIKRGDEK